MLTDSKITKQRKVKQLVDNGYITIKRVKQRSKHEKRVRLNFASTQVKELLPTLFAGAEDYAQYHIETNKSDATSQNRHLRLAETICMCEEAGYHVFPDEKPPLSEAKNLTTGEAYAYTSVEFKKAMGLADRKAIYTRFTAFLISEGGCYMVYNTTNHLIEWKTVGEGKAIAEVTNYLKTTNWDIPSKGITEAIVLTDTYTLGYDMITRPFQEESSEEDNAKGRRKRRSYLSIHYADYDHLYLLPKTRDGQRLLSYMAKPNWKQRYKDALIEPDAQARSIPIVADAWVGNRFYLLFYDCDLIRLNDFLNAANADQMGRSYIIYAYEFQRPLLEKLCPANVTIDTELTIEDIMQATEI